MALRVDGGTLNQRRTSHRIGTDSGSAGAFRWDFRSPAEASRAGDARRDEPAPQQERARAQAATWRSVSHRLDHLVYPSKDSEDIAALPSDNTHPGVELRSVGFSHEPSAGDGPLRQRSSESIHIKCQSASRASDSTAIASLTERTIRLKA